jgi:hypothetical protein
MHQRCYFSTGCMFNELKTDIIPIKKGTATARQV